MTARNRSTSRSSCVPIPRNVPAGRSGLEQPRGELEELLVHVRLAREGHARRLRGTPPSPGESPARAAAAPRGRPASGAGRPAGTRRPPCDAPARAAEQLDRRVDVLAALHVDPDHARASLGARDELAEVLLARVDAEVEPELGELDRRPGCRGRSRRCGRSPRGSGRSRRRPRPGSTGSRRAASVGRRSGARPAADGRRRAPRPASRRA